MELRRPRLADKETVLEMMESLKRANQPTMADFGILRILFTKSGWRQICKKKWE